MMTSIVVNRLLPNIGEVIVDRGQEVIPTNIVARSSVSSKYLFFDAGAALGVGANEVEQYLLAEVGTVISQGTPLLRQISSKDKAKFISSPLEGVLVEVFDGNLVVQQSKKLLELRAMVQGKVARVIPGRGVIIELAGSLIQALWDSGSDGQGQLILLTKSGSEELSIRAIGSEVGRKIVAAGRVSRLEVLEALEDNHIRGLVVGSMPARLKAKAAEFMFPIFITDGFGNQIMSEPIFSLLLESAGKELSLLSNSGGSGSQRSEIVIPSAEPSFIEGSDWTWKDLEIGDYVRIVTSKLNVLGKVVNIPEQPRRTVSGAWLTGADIKLDSGEEIFAPYTNMDIII